MTTTTGSHSLMKVRKKSLRCFAEFRDGVWLAYCLELGLGAQGQSFKEVRANLEAQIHDLSPEEVHALLRQGSPLRLRLRYALLAIAGWVVRQAGGATPQRKRFREALPPTAMAC